jgi:hypothetical protein
MKALEIKEILSEYLRQNGTERFTKLISDAIDETGAHNKQSIHSTREKFVKKFIALSEFNLTER